VNTKTPIRILHVDGRVLVAQVAENAHTIAAGQRDVQHERVVTARGGERVAFVRRCRSNPPPIPAPQAFAQKPTGLFVVLDQQDFHAYNFGIIPLT